MKQISNPYILAALACTGGLLFGFDIASLSAIIGTKNYAVYYADSPVTLNEQTGVLETNGVSTSLQGGITASMPGGSFVGALASGIITDWVGRRQSIAISFVIWILGSILSCASQNVAMLVVGRFICGISIGIASAQVPVYLSELAQTHIRGRLVALQQWAITWGICLFYYISYGCSFIGEQDGRGTASFRVPWGLQMIPAIVLLGFIPFMPRSPRWLASKGRWDECHDVLALVHGNGDKNNPLVIAEFKEIQTSLAEEKGSSWLDLFRGNMLNRTHIAVFTQIWSQLTGMNVMMYYISYVFQMAGLRGNINLLSSSIQYVINVVMTVPALVWLEKWGRRPTLLIGAALMMTWLFANAAIFKVYGHPHIPNPDAGESKAVSWSVEGKAGKAVIACTYLFVASYAPTWGPVSWVYPPELFPTRVRGKAVALATSGNWIFNFALSYFVPPSFEHIQWKTYIVFGVFCATMFIHVFFLFPETKGKSLEEMDEIFESGIPAWKSGKLSKHSKLQEMAAAIQRGEAVDGGKVLDKTDSQSDTTPDEKEKQLA